MEENDQNKRTSKLAITSFIIGILSIPLFFFKIGSLALILGIVSLFLIRKNNLKGKGFAILGIILGIAGIILAFIPFSTWFGLAFGSSPTKVDFDKQQINSEISDIKLYSSNDLKFSINYPSSWSVKNLDFLNKPQGKGVRLSMPSSTYPNCTDCFGGAEVRILTYNEKVDYILSYLGVGSIGAGFTPKVSDVQFAGYDAKLITYEEEGNEQYIGQKLTQKIFIFRKEDKTFTVGYRVDSSLSLDGKLDNLLSTFKFI